MTTTTQNFLLSAQRLNIFYPFFLCVQLFCVKVLLAQTVCINELYSQAQVLKETFFFIIIQNSICKNCANIYPQRYWQQKSYCD